MFFLTSFWSKCFRKNSSLYLMSCVLEKWRKCIVIAATNIVSFDAVSPILVRKRTHPYFHLKFLHLARRKIRPKEGNAKSRHLKKSTCKGVLRQVFICLKMKTRRLHDSPLPLLNFSYLMRFTFSVWVTWTFSVTSRVSWSRKWCFYRRSHSSDVPCRDDTSCDKTSQSKTSHARYILRHYTS